MDLRNTLLGLGFVITLLARISSSTNITKQHKYTISNSTSVKCETYSRVSLFHVFIKFCDGVPTPQLGRNCLHCNIISNNSHFLIRASLIMLLYGDIQTNPGPRTPKAPKYPCGNCRKNVNTNHKAMECEECFVWYHTKCMGISENFTRYICNIIPTCGYAINVVSQTLPTRLCLPHLKRQIHLRPWIVTLIILTVSSLMFRKDL